MSVETRIVGTGYGRVIGLQGSPAALEAVRLVLPFWWVDSDAEPEMTFDVASAEIADWVIRDVEHWVAEHAVGFVFVHAAVVAVGGRALLLPGPSRSGKTTLCVELLKAGADFLSDEYAVLDRSGLVHPYPRPLHVRNGSGRRRVLPDSLGATTVTGGLPVDVLAMLRFDERAGLDLSPLSGARAVLDVLAHVVPAKVRPHESLAHVHAAVAGAIRVAGTRGPAADAAGPLAAMLRTSGTSGQWIQRHH